MSSIEDRRIIILTSGGPDSATVAKLVRDEGADLVAALYLRSGHPSDEAEIRAAQQLADELGISLEVVDVADVVEKLGGGALTRHAGGVLTDFGTAVMGTIAIAYAMRIRADLVCLGLHAEDAAAGGQYSERFLSGLSEVAAEHYANAPSLYAPLINRRKAEVIELGSQLGVDFSATWSCIVGSTEHCGICEACLARQSAFQDAGIEDPTVYAGRARQPTA